MPWDVRRCSCQPPPETIRRTAYLPDFALLFRRTHHGVAGLAVEGFLEFGKIRERPVHAIFADGVRIGQHHLPLRLRTHLVAARLSPGDEELLLRSEAFALGAAILHLLGTIARRRGASGDEELL